MSKKKASRPLDRKQMKNTKGGTSTVGGLTEQQMTGLQGMTSQSSNTSQAISNLLKKSSDTTQSIAQNLK